MSDPNLTQLEELIGTGVKSLFSENDRLEAQDTGNLIKGHEYLSDLSQKRQKKRMRPGRISMGCSY